MKKSAALLMVLICFTAAGQTQNLKTQNLIIVTLDGLRWQEVFQGADSILLRNRNYCTDKFVKPRFWRPSPIERRAALLPFFWNVIGKSGQLYGNRQYNSEVNCANPHWFSYPGYSEILTGMIEKEIKSNDKVENPNPTVLEFIHNLPEFNGRVAAFGTWDVFPFIFRESKSGIPVNAGKETGVGISSESQELVNSLQALAQNPHGSRYDAFTFYHALEYLKQEKPRVLFIGFDETDQHGHGGRYDGYLKSAHNADKMLATLWNLLQSLPQYKDRTTLLITTDHGRGNGQRSWKNHGRLYFGSGQVWAAVIGPDTPPIGEVTFEGRYYLKQLAKTSAAFLGLDYTNSQPVGEIIGSMVGTSPMMPVFKAEIQKKE